MSSNPFASFLNGYDSINKEELMKKWEGVQTFFANLEMTVQALGFLAGCSLAGLGGLGLMSATLSLHPINILFNLFEVVFGVTMCLLEVKNMPQLEDARKWIASEMHILYTPYGRSAFYMLAGCFLISTPGYLNFLVGAFTTFVGFIGSISAKVAIDTLSNLLDDQYTESQISSHFDRFDTDRSGDLDKNELKELCQNLLSKTLTDGQLEAAIFTLDSNRNGKIDKNEFITWWKKAKDERENGGVVAKIKKIVKTIIPIPLPF